MGGLISKNRNDISNLDLNSDGVVTKTEFEEWYQKNNERLMKLEQTQENNIRLNNEVESLNKKNKELEKENSALIKKLEELNCKNEEPNKIINSEEEKAISRAIIKNYVNDMLKNEDINIKYLPDSVERGIYENVFHLMLNLLADIGDKNTVNLLGHKLKINLSK